MRRVSSLTLCILACLPGCARNWVYLTETPTTKHYLDANSLLKTGDTQWEVRERFLDRATERWYLEAEVQYDCSARTFMTLKVRGFSERRPLAHAEVVEGNVPVRVTPGSTEEARLEAVCALTEIGGGAPQGYPSQNR